MNVSSTSAKRSHQTWQQGEYRRRESRKEGIEATVVRSMRRLVPATLPISETSSAVCMHSLDKETLAIAEASAFKKRITPVRQQNFYEVGR